MILNLSKSEQNKVAKEAHKKLTQSKQTIAVAESLTGGHLQALLTRLSGSSAFFLGGLTAYTLDSKVKLLGIDRDHAASCNCVSATVALDMALGVRKLFGSNIGIGTTGYAEPYPEEGVDKPKAYYAIVWGDGPKDFVEGCCTLPWFPNTFGPKVTRLFVQQTVSQKILYVLTGLDLR